MCGIVYGKRADKKPIAKPLIKRYLEQKARGQEGFGYIPVYNGKISGVKRFEKEAEALVALEKESADEVLFHHRYPTSTPNYRELNHPIEIKSKLLKHNYYVVHNGVITNDDELYTKHGELGFKYSTLIEETIVKKTKGRTIEESTYQFNDSECLAIELALCFDGKKNSLDVEGSVAFVAYQTDKQGNILNLFYGKNYGNPLVLETCGNEILFLKSEGKGDKVDSHEITKVDYKTGKHETLDIAIGTGTYGKFNASYNNSYGYQGTIPLPRKMGIGLYEDEDEWEETNGSVGTTKGFIDDEDHIKRKNTLEDKDYDSEYQELAHQQAEAVMDEMSLLTTDLQEIELKTEQLVDEMTLALEDKDTMRIAEISYERSMLEKAQREIEELLARKEFDLQELGYAD